MYIQLNESLLGTRKLFTKPVYVWITDASPFKISGEQLSRSNREGRNEKTYAS